MAPRETQPRPGRPTHHLATGQLERDRPWLRPLRCSPYVVDRDFGCSLHQTLYVEALERWKDAPQEGSETALDVGIRIARRDAVEPHC
jgi:hypothetical protein